MCGIIAYTGRRPAARLLLDGLSRLEYRGYDSAGIAVIEPSGEPVVRKASGKLATLVESLGDHLPEGSCGIGHTRWATHGGPTESNAHPHTDCLGEIAVAHNGIVENFMELRRELEAEGHRFSSQTDSECIPHLIESGIKKGRSLEEAVREAAGRIRGSHAVVVASKREPDKIVAFRLGNAGGIVVGYGQDEMLLASDLPALLPHTRSVTYLAAGETVCVTSSEVRYGGLDGSPVDKTATQVPYDPLSAVKGEYKHFMEKEIYEQPEAVVNTLRGAVVFDKPRIELKEFPLSDREIRDIEKVVLIGMGTSLHAAMVGRNWIESLARISAEADNSSEFRHRDPIIDERTLVISVCQSGETADTLAAMETAANRGARQVTLCNYEGTQTSRIADGTVLIRAGLEIGVAASKTFVCSLTALYLIALHLAAVDRVLRVVEMTPLPEAPDVALGVINVQGRIVPVLSIRRQFGLPDCELRLSDRFIIAHTSRGQVALLVDDVTGVIAPQEAEVTAAEDILAGLRNLDGVVKSPEQLILVHDLDRILTPEEESVLTSAVETVAP